MAVLHRFYCNQTAINSILSGIYTGSLNLFALFYFLLSVIGYHLVVLPKHDDQSKAVLAACTEKQLIKLAAKEFSKSKGLPGTLPDGREITVPKILDKEGVYIIHLF